MNRVIRKSKAQSAGEALDLLSALFVAEILSPSVCLWLVSPWISDIDTIDNTAGTFHELNRFGRRQIRLTEIVAFLADAGTRIVIATTSDVHNLTFRTRLRLLANDLRVADRINVLVDPTGALHTKALTGNDFALAGSMNITYNGIHLREEQIELRTDPMYVAQARMDAFDRFGGAL
jgi:hypothetical protein